MRRSSSGWSLPPLTLPISMSVWPDQRCRVTSKPARSSMKRVQLLLKCGAPGRCRQVAREAGTARARHGSSGCRDEDGPPVERSAMGHRTAATPILNHRFQRRFPEASAAASTQSPRTAEGGSSRGAGRPVYLGLVERGEFRQKDTVDRDTVEDHVMQTQKEAVIGHPTASPGGRALPVPGTMRRAGEDPPRRCGSAAASRSSCGR